MTHTKGWLARVARRFGEMISGASPTGMDGEAPPPRPTEISPATSSSLPRQSDIVTAAAGVELSANGRYLYGGYSFSTSQEAAEYAAKMARTTAAVPGTAAKAHAPSTSKTQQAQQAKTCWLSTATTVQVGTRIANLDMVYYGTPSRHDPARDKSRIDPRQPINPEGDPLGTTLSYWQSYDGLDPRARWTYLDWLENGRTNPEIPIGYVFVFFYGLEQRLLVDDAKNEASAIFAELRRLVAIHGRNYSFASYAAKLLSLAYLYGEDSDEPITSAPPCNYDGELPLNVRVRLGRRLEGNQPLSADDCILWVLSLPGIYLRTPGQRCFSELLELWRIRFADRSPEGLRVRKPKSKIRSKYQAASNTFSRPIELELPDISGTQAPLNALRAILEGCIEDLSPYSRLLGRDPDARGRLRGDLLLPLELRRGRSSLAAYRTVLDLLAPDGLAAAQDILAALDLEVEPDGDKLPAILVRQMGLALDALDLGFEPDRRYGPAATLRTNTPIILFPASFGGAIDPEREPYVAARDMVEVAMLAAVSDGNVAPSEMDAIERRLRMTPDLSEVEIARLFACGKALAAAPPKLRAALKKLANVAPESRVALAASAIEAVLADGRVLPDEVKFLEALHTALGLPLSGLYSALHRNGEDVGPVEVLPPTAERSVPLPNEPTISGVAIDAAKLERIRGETTQVSAMLASIFVEEEPEPAPIAPRTNVNASTFAGLDAPHSELLQRLIRGPMARSEFDAIAAELRLMPEGAIETLNEWGFDTIGEPILDDDDEVLISPDIIDQLEPMGVVA